MVAPVNHKHTENVGEQVKFGELALLCHGPNNVCALVHFACQHYHSNRRFLGYQPQHLSGLCSVLPWVSFIDGALID